MKPSETVMISTKQIDFWQNEIKKLQERLADADKTIEMLGERLTDADHVIAFYDSKDFHYEVDGVVMGAEPAHKYFVKWGIPSEKCQEQGDFPSKKCKEDK